MPEGLASVRRIHPFHSTSSMTANEGTFLELPEPFIGCCGWAGSQAQYFATFPAIEIQSTFYAPPAPKVAQRWRATAPDSFIFCIKARQLITHPSSSPTYRRLRQPLSPEQRNRVGGFQDTDEIWSAWQVTREIADAVQAAVVLFQCPASFRATAENIRNVRKFFQRLGKLPFCLAWEPRGPWPPEVIKDLCTELELIHCVDPFINCSVGGPIYWRLHGKGSYSYRYTPSDLELLRKMYLNDKHGSRAYIMFNNVSMKEDALQFARQLGGAEPQEKLHRDARSFPQVGL